MPEHDIDQLDSQICNLVGRAVADAPNPPVIDPGAAPVPRPSSSADGRPQRVPWIVGGLAALSAAAALIGIVAINRGDQIATPRAPANASSAPPASDLTTVATTLFTTSPTTSPDTSPPATSTDARPADPALASLVSAGPNGVTVIGPDGARRTVTTEPMAQAWLAPDGAVYMQRPFDIDDESSHDSVLVVTSEGATSAFELTDLAERMTLHDVASVGGRITLLLEAGPAGPCQDPNQCETSLYTFEPDSGAIELVQTRSAWEGGWSDLELTDTGVVVGTEGESVTTWLYSAGVSDGIDPVAAMTLGLDGSYGDCDCPTAYTIDRVGNAVAWVEPSAGAPVVVVSAPQGGGTVRVPLTGEAVAECCSVNRLYDWIFGELLIADIQLVGDRVAGRAVLNPTRFVVSDLAPMIIDLATGETTLGEPGATLTFG